LGVNAFDQPDVQDNKDRTLIKVNAYRQSGTLDEPDPLAEIDGIGVFTNLDLEFKSTRNLLEDFVKTAKHGDYIAINAYLPRNEEISQELLKLRTIFRKRTGCATTLGFGPRFLHSTGQLHKGGPPSGLFLQITADPIDDVDIPGQELSFGVLERAPALGDYEALSARGRRILRLHLRTPDMLHLIVDALD
jgi:transaldolase/glucose-6-phosphate isomerase